MSIFDKVKSGAQLSSYLAALIGSIAILGQVHLLYKAERLTTMYRDRPAITIDEAPEVTCATEERFINIGYTLILRNNGSGNAYNVRW